MPQVFSRTSVTALKLGLVFGTLAVAGTVFAVRAALGYSSAYGPPIGQPPAQPVPFSHEHHVAQDGLDCRYCHTSVETSAFAGIPSTQICMTCHSVLFDDAPILAPVRASWEQKRPLRWQRVNDLPDFVYFDHSAHVTNGVGCVTCHGRVDRMPLTWRTKSLEMQWCLDCHRNPEPHLRPRDRVYDMDPVATADPAALGRELAGVYAIDTRHLTECWVCHR
jgi:Cytochrome c7 and related cytochrome c